METLGQAIRQDNAIEGIQIPGSKQQQSKVSQYAIDTKLILANDYSITQCFYIVNTFEKGSGSCLSTTKNEGFTPGPDYPPDGSSACGSRFFKMAALSGQRLVGMSVKGFWAKSADFNEDFRSLGTMQPEMVPFFVFFSSLAFHWCVMEV